mmetsp:Transcript_20804/g.37826  ORF Transcript_20804/g.37826 Transcript_20804/m.37826 type:complete len:348 (+) Transcript_20804:1982-3025(+)
MEVIHRIFDRGKVVIVVWDRRRQRRSLDHVLGRCGIAQFRCRIYLQRHGLLPARRRRRMGPLPPSAVVAGIVRSLAFTRSVPPSFPQLLRTAQLGQILRHSIRTPRLPTLRASLGIRQRIFEHRHARSRRAHRIPALHPLDRRRRLVRRRLHGGSGGGTARRHRGSPMRIAILFVGRRPAVIPILQRLVDQRRDDLIVPHGVRFDVDLFGNVQQRFGILHHDLLAVAIHYQRVCRAGAFVHGHGSEVGAAVWERTLAVSHGGGQRASAQCGTDGVLGLVGGGRHERRGVSGVHVVGLGEESIARQWMSRSFLFSFARRSHGFASGAFRTGFFAALDAATAASRIDGQ